jgi:hypothetical protein
MDVVVLQTARMQQNCRSPRTTTERTHDDRAATGRAAAADTMRITQQQGP